MLRHLLSLSEYAVQNGRRGPRVPLAGFRMIFEMHLRNHPLE